MPFTLLSTGTRTKALVVHSLSLAAEDGEDDDFGVSDYSGDMKTRKESSELPSSNSLPKLDGNILTPVLLWITNLSFV